MGAIICKLSRETHGRDKRTDNQEELDDNESGSQKKDRTLIIE